MQHSFKSQNVAERPSHVTVIGSGIVGLSTAFWLVRSGYDVTIVDRSLPFAETDYQSSCSFGNACTIALGAVIPVATPNTLQAVPGMLLRSNSPLAINWRDLLHLMPWLANFLRSSTPRRVDEIVRTLGALMRQAEQGHVPIMNEVKAHSFLRRNGCLYLYRTDSSLENARKEFDLREREGVRLEYLDRKQVHDREPNLAPLYSKGVLFSDAYSVDDPVQYSRAIADWLRSRGVRFQVGYVDHIVPRDDGVELIVNGSTGKADAVVVAAGAWSKTLAAQVGDRILLDTERGYHVLFPEGGTLLNAPTCYPEFGFYMTPLAEGLRAAGTVELGGVGKPLRQRRIDVIANMTRRLLPAVGPGTRSWLGFRPSMPDSLPVIGPSPRSSRVIYAFGHGHIGLTLAGITGRLVTGILEGATLPLDIAPLRPTRF